MAVLLLTVWLVAGPVAEAQRLRDRLSPIADPYSEANAIRGAHAYLARGLTANASLPETTFGGLYPNRGDLAVRRAPHVDTHYPPGPMWLAAAMKHACGSRPLSCLRALPLAVGALGAGILGLSLVRALGAVRGLTAVLATFSLPLYSNMMHGLHYQGYALALLSIQLGALVGLFAGVRPLATRDLALAGGLGFLQGWLSFDYFFLVALAPLPIAALFSDLRDPKPRRRAAALVLVSAAGFAAAHALHLLQVAVYHGGLGAALQDLLGAAGERSDPTRSAELRGRPPPLWATDPWMISNMHVFLLSDQDAYFGFSLGYALLAALFVVGWLRGARLSLPGTGVHLCVDSSTRAVWAILTAGCVSCAWIATMRGHAVTHTNFIPRHLFLAWLVMTVAVLHSIRVERSEPGAALPNPLSERA